jgi:hypothetical protein
VAAFWRFRSFLAAFRNCFCSFLSYFLPSNLAAIFFFVVFSKTGSVWGWFGLGSF